RTSRVLIRDLGRCSQRPLVWGSEPPAWVKPCFRDGCIDPRCKLTVKKTPQGEIVAISESPFYVFGEEGESSPRRNRRSFALYMGTTTCPTLERLTQTQRCLCMRSHYSELYSFCSCSRKWPASLMLVKRVLIIYPDGHPPQNSRRMPTRV